MEAIGVTPLPVIVLPEAPAEPGMPGGPSAAPVSAFEKGVAAPGCRNKAREGHLRVPRAHVEALPDGSEVKLGVFLSNTKTRRAKLSTDKLAALAGLGLEWAA